MRFPDPTVPARTVLLTLLLTAAAPITPAAGGPVAYRAASYTQGGYFSFVQPLALAADRAGVVVAGRYLNTVDFDPGRGEMTLTSGHGWNSFVASYNPAGRIQWVRGFQGISNEAADVTLDPAGDVIVVGSFFQSAEFGLGSGARVLTAPGGGSDGYVVKLDRRGRLKWARQHGVNGSWTYSVATDSRSSIWVTSRSNQPTSLLRLDPQGNVTWSALIGFRAFALAMGADDSVFLAGDFGPLTDFDPGPGVHLVPAIGYLDAFVVRLSSSAELLWVVSAGGAGQDVARSMIAAADGGVTLLGGFSDLVDFDPCPTKTKLLDGGGGAGFVWRLSREGQLVSARRSFEKGVVAGVSALAGRPDGSELHVGSLRGELSLSPSVEVASHGLRSDALVLELTPDDEIRWGGGVGGYGTDVARAVAVFGRNVYVAGSFSDFPADLDPTDGEEWVGISGREEMFLLRLLTDPH
jgi:hypothetical protein